VVGGGGGGTAGYDQSPDRELFKGLSRDRVLRRRVTWESGPARSSSIRIRATVVEVTGWRFTSPRGTLRIFRFAGKRTRNVSPLFRQRQRTAILYYCSSQIQPDDTDTCIACTTSNGDIEEGGHHFKI
jgi:hypothetical protein